MAVDIPQELVDDVLDYLASDRTSLLATSLVCHAFVSRSQLHLFRRVEIKSRGPNDPTAPETRASKVTRLGEAIRSSANLARHVRELHIEISSLTEENTWIWTDAVFLDIISQFNSLSDIELMSRHFLMSSPLEDMQMFERAFWTPFIAPRISSVFIDSFWVFPAALLTDCSNLTRLGLYNTNLERITPSDISSRSLPLRLISFEFNVNAGGGSPFPSESLMSLRPMGGPQFLDLGRLRTFKCNIHATIPPEINNVLLLAKNSLEKLEIRSILADLGTSGLLSLSDLPMLRSIRLASIVHEYRSHPNIPNSVVGISDILGAVGATTNIRKVKIVIAAANSRLSEPGIPPVHWLDTSIWESFDRAINKLQTKAGYALQLRVHLYIAVTPEYRVSNGTALSVEVMKDFPTKCLPLALSNENIRIHYTYKT